MLAEPYHLNTAQFAMAAGKFQENNRENIVIKITTTKNDELNVSETSLPWSCLLGWERVRTRIAL